MQPVRVGFLRRSRLTHRIRQPRRESVPPRLRRPSSILTAHSPKHLAGDDELLDLAGPLVQAEQPGVPAQPLDRYPPQVARPAVDLHRPVGHPADRLAREVLGARGRQAPVCAAVVGGGGFEDQRARPPGRSASRRAFPARAGTRRSGGRTGGGSPPRWPTRRPAAASTRRTARRCGCGRGRGNASPSRIPVPAVPDQPAPLNGSVPPPHPHNQITNLEDCRAKGNGAHLNRSSTVSPPAARSNRPSVSARCLAQTFSAPSASLSSMRPSSSSWAR